MGRGQASRSQQHLDEMGGDINSRMIGGPLPDPRWDGLMQAFQENHVGRVGQTAYGGNLPSTSDPSFQSSAAEGLGPSHNMASVQAGHPIGNAALNGLLQAGEPGGDVSHAQWMLSKGRGSRLRVEDQKGSGAMNNSQRYRMPGAF